jgi:hypothetical protein
MREGAAKATAQGHRPLQRHQLSVFKSATFGFQKRQLSVFNSAAFGFQKRQLSVFNSVNFQCSRASAFSVQFLRHERPARPVRLKKVPVG